MNLEELKRESVYVPQNNTTTCDVYKRCKGFFRIVSKDSVENIPIDLQYLKLKNIKENSIREAVEYLKQKGQ